MSDVSFPQSFQQGNRTMPIVREILGLAFFRVADQEDNTRRNTDLIYNSPYGAIRVSVRIRTYKELEKRPWIKDEFTLCCGRHSGYDAEYQKIKKGFGDFIVYGFENEKGDNLYQWFIGDLNIFRKWDADVLFRHDPKKDDEKLGFLTKNGKGVGTVQKVPRTDSRTKEDYFDYFYAYKKWALPRAFIIADSKDWKGGNQ